ncbi:NUDIX hydrolase [Ornithinibacillus xuwenensis]|uniref:NUDIX hydrolase n=1 Tax=Ornithinibacillus xuwenensis TaxID=3144668 RepID=A0ABU9XGY5_9BACI
MGYINDLRKIVGTRPLLMVGACTIVINNRKEILLQCRRDNGCWGLPGGAADLGETLEEVAKRELLEETGLRAQNLTLFNVYSGDKFYYKYPHGDEVYNVITAYLCSNYDGVRRNEESEVLDLKYFDVSALPSTINPPDLPIILDYIDFASKQALHKNP